MAYFSECEHCGAALDPGERCDCQKTRAESREHIQATRKMKQEQRKAERLAGRSFPIIKAV